jgi:hypothetical protein
MCATSGTARAYSFGVRPRYAFAAIALASAVVLAAGLDTTPEHRPAAPPARLLGVTNEGGTRWLARVAPVSLRPLPGRRRRVGAPLEAWALSPGGSRLAAVSDRGSLLHLIDVERMRTLGRLRTGARGSPAAVVWSRPRRLWIVLAVPGCCAVGSTTVVAVDPIAEQVVARRRLAGGLVRVAGSPEGPVLLLAPPAIIGPARLVTVDAAGGVEQLPLDGVSAGAMPTERVPSVERVRTPALAFDPGRRRAYVVSSRPEAVEIDLRRRRVTDHRLVARASLLDRLRDLLEPPAAAAGAQVGVVRRAAWIGEGRIALTGYDADVVWRPHGAVEAERRPAGLHVIDTRDWSVRTLDERASDFVAAAGLLLTSGPGGRGLAAYSPEGRDTFHVLGDRHVEVVATAGSLAYVRTPPEPALQVVDVTRGRVIGTSAPGRATLLLERVAAGWE